MDVYNEFTGLRKDGRRPNEMRIIDAKIGTIPGSTGSAHFKMGQTEVIAQVFVPDEGKSGDRDLASVQVILEYADFAKSPHRAEPNKKIRNRETELIIQRTFEEAICLESFPHAQINISITIIQDDGGCQSAAINAASLALIEAGIPMIDFVVSLSSVFIDEFDQVFLDTNRVESTSKFPILELAIFPSTSEIVSMNLTSRISPENAKKMNQLALDGCIKLHKLLSEIVRSR